MNDQPKSETPEKKHVGGELVIPVSALLFTIYYFVTKASGTPGIRRAAQSLTGKS